MDAFVGVMVVVPCRGDVQVETDAPYLSIDRRRESHPSDVVAIVRKLAELKGVDVHECARAVFGNTVRMFGLPDSESREGAVVAAGAGGAAASSS